MKYGRYGWSHLMISWGLGATFLWIGLDILIHPESWIGFVPPELPAGLTRDTALQLNGALDTMLGIFLLLRWWQKTTALLAALHLIGILVTNGIDAVIIRDIGLLGAALALLLWPTKYRKRRFGKLFAKKRKVATDDEG